MKNVIIVLLLFFCATCCYTQKPDPTSSIDYRKKATNQKVIAGVLLAGGTGIFYATILEVDFVFGSNERLIAPGIIGATMIIGSIPFIVAAYRNVRKYKSVSALLITERVPYFYVGESVINYPALALNFKF